MRRVPLFINLAMWAVTLVNQVTHERATVRFREAGFIMPPAMAQVDHIMRDMRTGMTGSIDPNLMIFHG